MRIIAIVAAWLLSAALALAQQGGGNLPVPGQGNSGYPLAAVPSYGVAVNTTNGATNATVAQIAGVAGQFAYLCGWNAFTNGGVAADVTITIQSLGPPAGGITLSYLFAVPAFSATSSTKIGDTYTPCVRSNVTGNGFNVSVPAQGTGNTNVTVNVWGYTQ